MNKRYVVGLGEVLWDVLPEGKKLGGAPANFAYHAGQFLGMDNTIAVSALGEDKLGDETIEALKEHGLNYLLPRVPYPTGTVQVQLDEQGIPTYDIKENVAWDNIPFDDDIAEIARNCRAVCFGSLAQRNVVSRETIQKFLDATPADCLKIFDINLRQQFYTQEILRESFQRCNILKINDEELVLIGRMFGYPDPGQVQSRHARAHLRHQRLLRFHPWSCILPGNAEGQGSRYCRRRRLLHRLVRGQHPQRQVRARGPSHRRSGQCLRLHTERCYACLSR